MKSKACVAFLATALMLSFSPIFAEDDIFGDIDLDSLFSEADVMVDEAEVVNDDIVSNQNQESVSFTGMIDTRLTYMMDKDWLKGNGDVEDNVFSSPVQGDFMLDIRLRDGFKAFANINLVYYPQDMTSSYSQDIEDLLQLTNYIPELTNLAGTVETAESADTLVTIKEIFVDMNINHAVYFRLGKQVLQWGRNYFWTPTDLINTDKLEFTDMERSREGVTGLKVTVPFGTAVNLYGFINATDVTELGGFGVAGKAEFLIGRTELAFSGWAKEGYLPVYGFDFSTRLGKFNLLGEMSLSYGENRQKWEETSPGVYEVTHNTNEWCPRISLGFNRSFDFMDVEDRIMLVGEFFYNHNGYSENVFNDGIYTQMFLYQSLITGEASLYEANYHGVYYGALFLTFSKFFDPNLTLNLNAMGNLSDKSSIATVGLSYNPIYNFNMGLTVGAFLGDKEKEYTYSGQGLYSEMSITFNF